MVIFSYFNNNLQSIRRAQNNDDIKYVHHVLSTVYTLLKDYFDVLSDM